MDNIAQLDTASAERLRQAHLCCLRHRFAVIKASGKRLLDYLQGQITQDIGRLSPSQAIHAALLTPQGKAVTDLLLLQTGSDEVLMVVPARHAEATVERLRRFALGFELRIGIFAPLVLISLQGAKSNDALARLGLQPPAHGHRLQQLDHPDGTIHVVLYPEAAASGYWLIVPAAQAEAVLDRLGNRGTEQAVEAARIIRGMPLFGRDWDVHEYPLNANLIEFDGVSFDKGCYVGQEVTSRMHWRKAIKRRLYRVQPVALPATLPCPVRTTAEIGTLTAAAEGPDGIFGIASLRIDAVESGAPFRCDDHDLTVLEACHG